MICFLDAFGKMSEIFLDTHVPSLFCNKAYPFSSKQFLACATHTPSVFWPPPGLGRLGGANEVRPPPEISSGGGIHSPLLARLGGAKTHIFSGFLGLHRCQNRDFSSLAPCRALAKHLRLLFGPGAAKKQRF